MNNINTIFKPKSDKEILDKISKMDYYELHYRFLKASKNNDIFIKRAVKPIHRFLAWIGCKAQI